MSEALLDVNLLIAAVVENHVHHLKAKNFIEALERFYTTPMTQGGFLRFMTRPWKDEQRQEQPPRMTMAQAFATLADITISAKHSFLPDNEPFVAVSLRSLSGHRQWTDAYLLMLARKNGLKLATLEGKLENMDDPIAPVLLTIS